MKVAIHQPHYLPWLGYLAKWAAADCFVFLDTVQYEKNGWQNRNRIKTKDGPQWLTVPVCRERDTLIRDVRIDTAQPWARRHLQAARLAYARPAHAVRLEQFAEAGITVLRQSYTHPVYAQLHGDFVPFLSSLDLLLNHGPAGLDILRAGDAYVPCA